LHVVVLFGVFLTADWSSTWEPGTAYFHWVEWCLVRVWRDWHEASVLLVIQQQMKSSQWSLELHIGRLL